MQGVRKYIIKHHVLAGIDSYIYGSEREKGKWLATVLIHSSELFFSARNSSEMATNSSEMAKNSSEMAKNSSEHSS